MTTPIFTDTDSCNATVATVLANLDAYNEFLEAHNADLEKVT